MKTARIMNRSPGNDEFGTNGGFIGFLRYDNFKVITSTVIGNKIEKLVYFYCNDQKTLELYVKNIYKIPNKFLTIVIAN